MTFEPHPVAVLHPERAPQIITDPDHRLSLLEATGLDAVLVMEFTRELASWTPEHFVRTVFVEALGARRRRGRQGHPVRGPQLRRRRHPARAGPRSTASRCSTWTTSGERRAGPPAGSAQLVAAGDVGAAAEILGRPHRVTGTVVHGDHRGRELGYPTANLGPDPAGLVPADGVYAGWLLRPGLSPDDPDHTMPAAVSIGTNPTFDGTQRRVEAYVLDRTDLDLYGEDVVLEFVERLRATERYDSIEALLSQMAQDVESCRRVLSSIVPS